MSARTGGEAAYPGTFQHACSPRSTATQSVTLSPDAFLTTCWSTWRTFAEITRPRCAVYLFAIHGRRGLPCTPSVATERLAGSIRHTKFPRVSPPKVESCFLKRCHNALVMSFHESKSLPNFKNAINKCFDLVPTTVPWGLYLK